jgi:hypothetical protein
MLASPRPGLIRALRTVALGMCLTLLGSACVPQSRTPDALPAPTVARWPVRTASHVDLWLHGFGLLTTDTTPIPLFRRGYRDSMIVLRNRANVLTGLDANSDSLRSRLARSPALQNAQFAVFSFPTWESLSGAIDAFFAAEGDPRRATSQERAAEINFLASQFPTPADRTWLRRFWDGLLDERRAFYEAWWTATQRDRSLVQDAILASWETTYRAKFQRFLNATNQRSGELLLSLPLGPEGRVASGREGQTVVAVPLPGRQQDAREALVVFAHEVTGSTVASAVDDHTTPAQKRDGSAARLVGLAQARAGALLLEALAPELVAPYARYYLAQGGHRVPVSGTDAALLDALARAYPVPTDITDAIRRQIEIALAGI